MKFAVIKYPRIETKNPITIDVIIFAVSAKLFIKHKTSGITVFPPNSKIGLHVLASSSADSSSSAFDS